MTQPPTPERPSRTAAATRARMWAREQRMAAELAARGWTCTPPADHTPPPSVDLVAVVRPAGATAVEARDARVTVCGPPGPGSRPRANLDGAGPHVRATFIAPGVLVPARADSTAQTRPVVELLAAQGFDVTGGWVVGRDVDGRRYARVPVREVRR